MRIGSTLSLAPVLAALALVGCRTLLHRVRTDPWTPPPPPRVDTTYGPADTMIVWTFDRPPVERPLTSYPTVRFRPGDYVAVDARGCVNRGGWNNTWVSYLKPLSPFEQRLYYGTIWIPGITQGPEPVRWLASDERHLRWRRIDPEWTAPSALYLRLGFKDEQGHYWDNRYTGNTRKGMVRSAAGQCVPATPEQVAAQVRVHVHRGGTERVDTLPPAALDLVVDSADANGLPLNPQWAMARAILAWNRGATLHDPIAPHINPSLDPRPGHNVCGGFQYDRFRTRTQTWMAGVHWPTFPPCTNEDARITVDQPDGVTRLWCESTRPEGFKGHINWYSTTYVGWLGWNDYSSDGDYDLNLFPRERAGETLAAAYIHMEMNADEVAPRLRSPWWWQLANRGDSVRAALSRPRGFRSAVATGLLGLDAVHEARTELHPLFALAVQTEDTLQPQHWALLVRTEGNEGECSADLHRLFTVRDSFTFTLPWPRQSGASLAAVRARPFHYHTGVEESEVTPVVRVIPGTAVLVSVPLPPPDTAGERPRLAHDTDRARLATAAPLVEGEIYLDWTTEPGTPARTLAFARDSQQATTAADTTQQKIRDASTAGLPRRLTRVGLRHLPMDPTGPELLPEYYICTRLGHGAAQGPWRLGACTARRQVAGGS